MNITPFVSSSEESAMSMLKFAGVKPGEIVYDLGSGKGVIVITAAEKFGAKAVGIEIRKNMARYSKELVRKRGADVKIISGNFFDVDISSADVVTLYLDQDTNYALTSKLERELKPDARVVSRFFPITRWKPVAIHESELLEYENMLQKLGILEKCPHVNYLYPDKFYLYRMDRIR